MKKGKRLITIKNKLMTDMQDSIEEKGKKSEEE